jgi:hypothetical protein
MDGQWPTVLPRTAGSNVSARIILEREPLGDVEAEMSRT